MNRFAPASFSRRFLPRLLLIMLCSNLLVACGWFRKDDKKPEYYDAVETPDLKIPENLDQPVVPDALVISIPRVPVPQAELVTVPPRISSENVDKNASTLLKWSAEGAYLWVRDTPESVQRRLGFAIERAGMVSRETGMDGELEIEYRHEPQKEDKGFFQKMAFWRDNGPDYSGSYRVILRPDLDSTRIYIKNADGADSDPQATEHLLNIFADRLG